MRLCTCLARTIVSFEYKKDSDVIVNENFLNLGTFLPCLVVKSRNHATKRLFGKKGSPHLRYQERADSVGRDSKGLHTRDTQPLSSLRSNNRFHYSVLRLRSQPTRHTPILPRATAPGAGIGRTSETIHVPTSPTIKPPGRGVS